MAMTMIRLVPRLTLFLFSLFYSRFYLSTREVFEEVLATIN